MFAIVADNWCKDWYQELMKGSVMEHTKKTWSFQQGAGRQYHIKDENKNTLALVTGRTNAERICLCVNGWDELMKRANLAEAAIVKFEQLAGEERIGLESERDVLQSTLSRIIADLPTNKDWLDPDLEKLAIALCAK